MEAKIITEGKAKIKTWTKEIVSKDMPVFYNPVMKFNRDISVLLLNSTEKENMQIGDPMAGTGIRAVRLLTELKKGKIKNISVNDLSEKAVKLVKENIELNKDEITSEDIEVANKDANLFILASNGFDYLDIDPFGSPNHFLDSSMERISRGGILAVTSTDTAALCGTYISTCRRKYWATPIRNEHMHEIGIRILIRKIQLVASQYEKSLTPIFSYYKDHYFRIFFRCDKSKTKADEIIKQHMYFHYCVKCLNYEVSKKNSALCCNSEMEAAGPLWSGDLNDKALVKKMVKNNDESSNENFLNAILNESEKNIVGSIDLHRYSQKYNARIPRTDDTIKKLRNSGFYAEKTIFGLYGIKTDATIKQFAEIIK